MDEKKRKKIDFRILWRGERVALMADLAAKIENARKEVADLKAKIKQNRKNMQDAESE